MVGVVTSKTKIGILIGWFDFMWSRDFNFQTVARQLTSRSEVGESLEERYEAIQANVW